MRYQCQKLGTNKIYDTTNIKTMINKQDILDVAKLQTNFVGRTTNAYEYVGELNDLIGRNAFSCSTKRVDQSPQTEWIISGKDITSEEIERLNLNLDFIID